MAQNSPLVSIGLPVYNGENYLAKTIRSILAQTFADFELIICDNASTDRTQVICEEFARQDARVRYSRNERNLGAGPNYDLAFHRAQGKYFKWAAHDDMLAPTYLEKTVAVLEARPDVAMCSTGITEIGPDDEVVRSYTNSMPGCDGATPAQRLAAVTHYRHQCEDFFGLYRREALEGSDLHGLYSGSDRVLLAEIALRGKIVLLDEPLFLHREHNQRYTRAVLLTNRKKATNWQDTSGKTKVVTAKLFHITVYKNLWRIVEKNIHDPKEKRACEIELWRWWIKDDHIVDTIRDTLQNFAPAIYLVIQRVKRTLFGIGSARPGDLTPTH